MAKRKAKPRNPIKTPRWRIKATLRQLWLRSRERAAALKRDAYTCQRCDTKQSRAAGREFKVQVHHKREIDWLDLVDLVYERLLHHPDDLQTLCEECHTQEHKK